MIKIDLDAPIISGDRHVWRLFPGNSYKFLDTFRGEDVAFLDIPGFEMPDEMLSAAKDLTTRIRKSEIIIEKIAKDGRERIPTVTQEELKNFKVGKRRQRNQQAIINFYEKALPGDVVIVPDRLNVGKVLIGQFPERKRAITKIAVEKAYGKTPIPARHIKWIDYISENKISTDLSNSLRQQHPFSLLERSLFLEVFSLAFSSYVYLEQHNANVYNTKDDYLDRESSLIGIVSTLSAVACERVSKGHIEPFNVAEAIFDSVPIDFYCSQASDIHSPGFNRFTSARATPLVIAAVVAALGYLALSATPAEMEQRLEKIEFVNSRAQVDDACTSLVSKSSELVLRSMGSEILWKKCQAMKEAEERAGLKSSAKVGN